MKVIAADPASQTNQKSSIDPSERRQWGLVGAIGAAIAASICCIGPLVLVALGASGAWIGSLSALEPYRPLFVAVTAGFLGLAFYRVYRRPRGEQACAPGSACARPRSQRINKITLWVATVLAAGMLAAPSVIGGLSTDDVGAAPATRATPGAGGAATERAPKHVTLAIEKMTCTACTVTLTKVLKRVPGVKSVRVTLAPPRAVVSFDPLKATIADLVRATGHVGYPSQAMTRKDR